MAISQIPALTAHYSESSTIGRPVLGRCNPCQMAISQIPTLLWKLIFVRLSVGRSTPPSYGNFTDFCSDNSYFIPTLKAPHLADQVLADVTPVKLQFYRFLIYSESSYLADQVLADLLPHINGNFTDSYSTLRDHIWQTKFWQIYPHIKWQFYRFLWNSYFIPTLRAQHLADQVLADLPPCQMAILQIPALLSKLIFSRPTVKWWFHRILWNSYFIHTLRAQHLADQVMADLSPIKWQFHGFLLWQLTFHDSSYFIPTLRAHHLADQVLADLPPFEWQFHWFLLWQLLFHSYSESLTFGRPGPGISTPPHTMLISQIPVLTAHYSESSTFGRPVLGRCNPPYQMAISQIPALPWELIFGRPSVGRSTPPSYGNFTDCCSDSSYFTPTLRAQYLADKVFADLPPCQMAILQIPVKFIFHSYSESSTFGRLGHGRSIPNQMAISQIPALTAHISWQLIFHSYSESSTFGRPGLGRSTPIWVVISLIPTLTTFISFLLWELNIWQTRSWHIYPPIQWWFHRFLFWQLTTLRAQHLADQFLADVTPHIRWQIHRFLLYSESSYMADWVLADQHPPSYGNFTDCCSDSSYFIPILTAPHLADQVLADLPPLINGNFTDSYSTLRAHI